MQPTARRPENTHCQLSREHTASCPGSTGRCPDSTGRCPFAGPAPSRCPFAGPAPSRCPFAGPHPVVVRSLAPHPVVVRSLAPHPVAVGFMFADRITVPGGSVYHGTRRGGHSGQRMSTIFSASPLRPAMAALGDTGGTMLRDGKDETEGREGRTLTEGRKKHYCGDGMTA